MDTFDSTILPSGGSRLLSESPQFSLASASSGLHTGPGGDDLSLSELCPDDHRLPQHSQTRPHNQKTRPSIAQALGFGAPLDQSDDRSTLGSLEEGEGEWEGENEDSIAAADVTVRVSGEDADRTRLAAQSREEKLQSDLFVLRQLNGAFAVYNDALRETQVGTEVSARAGPSALQGFIRIFSFIFIFILHRYQRIAEQLEQTDALLNKYINLLSKSEQVTRLIFDERWMGAEAVCVISVFSPPMMLFNE